MHINVFVQGGYSVKVEIEAYLSLVKWNGGLNIITSSVIEYFLCSSYSPECESWRLCNELSTDFQWPKKWGCLARCSVWTGDTDINIIHEHYSMIHWFTFISLNILPRWNNLNSYMGMKRSKSPDRIHPHPSSRTHSLHSRTFRFVSVPCTGIC